MSKELVLIRTATYQGIGLDCYVEAGQQDTGEFWATNEQIGRLLGYVDPDVAIRKIHMRNKERLDKFSTSTKLVRVEGERTVTREVRLYSFKGLLEIDRREESITSPTRSTWIWAGLK